MGPPVGPPRQAERDDASSGGVEDHDSGRSKDAPGYRNNDDLPGTVRNYSVLASYHLHLAGKAHSGDPSHRRAAYLKYQIFTFISPVTSTQILHQLSLTVGRII